MVFNKSDSILVQHQFIFPKRVVKCLPDHCSDGSYNRKDAKAHEKSDQIHPVSFRGEPIDR